MSRCVRLLKSLLNLHSASERLITIELEVQEFSTRTMRFVSHEWRSRKLASCDRLKVITSTIFVCLIGYYFDIFLNTSMKLMREMAHSHNFINKLPVSIKHLTTQSRVFSPILETESACTMNVFFHSFLSFWVTNARQDRVERWTMYDGNLMPFCVSWTSQYARASWMLHTAIVVVQLIHIYRHDDYAAPMMRCIVEFNYVESSSTIL